MLTWKNCSCFSSFQKKGCMRTMGAEGRCWGSGLIIAAISSRATSLSVGETTQQRNNPPPRRARNCVPQLRASLWGHARGKGLTMSFFLQAAQLVRARQDVGLSPQAVPKGVLPS